MKKNVDILQELGRDLPRGGARARGSRGKPHVKAYYGMGLKTYTDALGNEVPLPLSYGIIQRAPKLLRDVAELWRAQGMNVVAQQFTAAHAVIGAVLDGCFVRQQENLYMLNLQVMIVGGAGSGKSRVALLDRLVEPIDRELRLGYRRRMDDYHRDLLRHAAALQDWKKDGGRGNPPLPPDEPLPRSLMLADATTQAALVRWLAGNDGHLSLMRHDELSTLKNALEDRCGGFGDVLKKAFDNGKHEKQLRTADEGYYIRRVGLATVFSTTPGVLKDFIGSYEDGLASRIIGHFTASEPTFDPDPSHEAIADFDARMERLVERVEELWRAVNSEQRSVNCWSSESRDVLAQSMPSRDSRRAKLNSEQLEQREQNQVYLGYAESRQQKSEAQKIIAKEPKTKVSSNHYSLITDHSSPPLGGAGGGLLLVLSPDQQARFTRHFRALMEFYVALDDLGEEAVPIIRRRAVDARRILMIWSLCRRTEDLYRDSAGRIALPADGLIRPTDDDLRTVLEYADYLVCQSVFMHRLVAGTAQAEDAKTDEPAPRRNPLEHLRLLPDVFNRDDANTAGKLCGVQNRSTGRRIVKWMGQGFIRETTDGEYEKTAKGRACGRKKS
jgi:hypothetical protein